MVPLTAEQADRVFPQRLGNMAVGVVTAIGADVTRFRPGDRVFGHLPIRETYTVAETSVDAMPEGMAAEAVVCLDPAVMALAIRDAPVRLGDRVAIFGLGAIGLMAVQLACIAGSELVIAVDPIAARRNLALALGADVALDPRVDGGDVGMAIRRIAGSAMAHRVAEPAETRTETRVLGGYREIAQQTEQRGVDVAVEVSGNTQALQQAIRATRFGGTICVLSAYGGDAAGLRLGDEFHVNRLQLVSARAQSLPMRDAPAWTLQRYAELVLGWLASGRLCTEGIVTPIVPFDECAEAYRRIDEHPEESVKLGICFP